MALLSYFERRRAVFHNLKSPLLKLPAELRNKIYDQVLPGAGTIIITCSSEKGRFGTRSVIASCPVPPLAHVCSQLRMEILPMFYSGKAVIWQGHGALDTTADFESLLRCLRKWLVVKKQLGILPFVQSLQFESGLFRYKKSRTSKALLCKIRLQFQGSSYQVQTECFGPFDATGPTTATQDMVENAAREVVNTLNITMPDRHLQPLRQLYPQSASNGRGHYG